jgi:phage regulator Rha-like protein
MTILVTIKDGEAVTTSLAIAEGTAATHEAVIKLVRTYMRDLEQFGLIRFEIRPRPPGQHGGSDAEYAVLNEQQSALVVAYMRNSEIVRAFKIALVKGFYEMRTKLTAQAGSLSELPPEQRALVALMVDNAKIKAKQDELSAAQAAQQDSIKRIEAKQSAIENGAGFFTVIGFGVMRNIKFSLSDAAAIGRRASALSKAAGIAIDKVRDPRFGEVNSYHESMLDVALKELHGGM